MAATVSDLSIYLSGGAANKDPKYSLGGYPSSKAVSSSANNLFDNITKLDSENGLIDYKCIYLFNNNETDNFYITGIQIQSQTEGGSSVEIGIYDVNDKQRVIISGNVTGGALTLNYDGSTFATSYNVDIDVWAAAIKSGLEGLSGKNLGVEIITSSSEDMIVFDIEFNLNNGTTIFANSRYHELTTVQTNSLTGSGPITVTTTKIKDGSPVNAIAPEIESKTNAPPNVVFSLGTVDANEGLYQTYRITYGTNINSVNSYRVLNADNGEYFFVVKGNSAVWPGIAVLQTTEPPPVAANIGSGAMDAVFPFGLYHISGQNFEYSGGNVGSSSLDVIQIFPTTPTDTNYQIDMIKGEFGYFMPSDLYPSIQNLGPELIGPSFAPWVLRPLEWLPIWVKRTTAAGASTGQDGFVLAIKGTS